MNLAQYIKKEAHNLGYVREKFEEHNVPENPKDIVVIPFFGDLRSLVLFSMFISNKLKSKYVIICSWHGFKDLFPDVDEYWSIKAEGTVDKLVNNVDYFGNDSNFIASNNRNLSYKFENVITDIELYYDNGFTQLFWDRFKTLELSMPQVDSISKLDDYTSKQLNKKNLFISPFKKIGFWEDGKLKSLHVDKEFWIDLIQLLRTKWEVIVWQNCFTHDVSPVLADSCFYLNDVEIDKVLIVMNRCLTIDVFGGLSRLALLARSNFIAVDERIRFFTQKDDVIDKISGAELEKHYIFSDSKMILGRGVNWRNAFIDPLLKKIELAIDKKPNISLNRRSENVDLNFREENIKKFGIHFIKK